MNPPVRRRRPAIIDAAVLSLGTKYLTRQITPRPPVTSEPLRIRDTRPTRVPCRARPSVPEDDPEGTGPVTKPDGQARWNRGDLEVPGVWPLDLPDVAEVKPETHAIAEQTDGSGADVHPQQVYPHRCDVELIARGCVKKPQASGSVGPETIPVPSPRNRDQGVPHQGVAPAADHVEADDQPLAFTLKEAGCVEEERLDSDGAVAKEHHRATIVPVPHLRCAFEIDERGAALEGVADERGQVPVRGGRRRKSQEEDESQQHASRSGAYHEDQRSMRRKTEAKSERVTSPDSICDGTTSPSLLASRIIVALWDGTFTISAE